VNPEGCSRPSAPLGFGANPKAAAPGQDVGIGNFRVNRDDPVKWTGFALRIDSATLIPKCRAPTRLHIAEQIRASPTSVAAFGDAMRI